MRFLNRFIPDDEAKCELNTLSKLRNALLFDRPGTGKSWYFSLDMASGYHNIAVHPSQWHLMGLALHVSELPRDAVEEIRRKWPSCEDKSSSTFYFTMRALPFGLATSCAVFSDVVTALTAAWRRHKVCQVPLRIYSYIDDLIAVCPSVRAALVAAVEVVFATTAAGLTLNIEKCALYPSQTIKFLGTIIDAIRGVFRLPKQRVARMALQVKELRARARVGGQVPAREVAQLVGLLWAASPCCPRAVAVMARGMIDTLTTALRRRVWSGRKFNPTHKSDKMSLCRLLARFWDGPVTWTYEAQNELNFWAQVEFGRLNAHISSDTLEALLQGVYLDTDIVKRGAVNFVATDASDVACGGGLLELRHGRFRFKDGAEFFSPLTLRARAQSSATREALAILWLLRTFNYRLARRVIAFTDSRVACEAIKRGSKTPQLQDVVRDIFVWSLNTGIAVFPCWIPRTTSVIKEADNRSRWRDHHGDRTPRAVFTQADDMAVRLWGRRISFDRQATHLNAMPPPGMGHKLPFNALWHQPGCAGVDMFVQPLTSWRSHINFIHPALPTVARVLTFLPETCARSVVVTPEKYVQGTWHEPWTVEGGEGVVEVIRTDGFRIVAIDHTHRSSPRIPRPDANFIPSS